MEKLSIIITSLLLMGCVTIYNPYTDSNCHTEIIVSREYDDYGRVIPNTTRKAFKEVCK